jgi:hypothetical protein
MGTENILGYRRRSLSVVSEQGASPVRSIRRDFYLPSDSGKWDSDILTLGYRRVSRHRC